MIVLRTLVVKAFSSRSTLMFSSKLWRRPAFPAISSLSRSASLRNSDQDDSEKSDFFSLFVDALSPLRSRHPWLEANSGPVLADGKLVPEANTKGRRTNSVAPRSQSRQVLDRNSLEI